MPLGAFLHGDQIGLHIGDAVPGSSARVRCSRPPSCSSSLSSCTRPPRPPGRSLPRSGQAQAQRRQRAQRTSPAYWSWSPHCGDPAAPAARVLGARRSPFHATLRPTRMPARVSAVRCRPRLPAAIADPSSPLPEAGSTPSSARPSNSTPRPSTGPPVPLRKERMCTPPDLRCSRRPRAQRRPSAAPGASQGGSSSSYGCTATRRPHRTRPTSTSTSRRSQACAPVADVNPSNRWGRPQGHRASHPRPHRSSRAPRNPGPVPELPLTPRPPPSLVPPASAPPPCSPR